MKFDTQIKFAFIETKLYWEDGFTAGDLADAYDLTRQTVQTLLNSYRQQYPNQMQYDGNKKRHIATAQFEPHYISKRTSDFLDYLRSQELRAHYLEERDWDTIAITDVDRLLRPALTRMLIQPVLTALRYQRTLLIDYRARTASQIKVRIISPNHLVFSDNRYHLRAYCHKKQEYLDFVLSRIIHAEFADAEWVSSDGDTPWQKILTLVFRPNQELPDHVKETLLRGHVGREQGVWEVTCREALAYYVRRNILNRFDEQRRLPLWIEITPPNI